MKKRLSFLLAFAILLLPGNPLLASSDEIPFFEALGNLNAVEDYKLVQSFYGNAEFEEYEDHISADYRISISSVVDGGSREDTFSRLSAYLKLTNHNEVNDSTPFREMTVQANGEIITKGQQDFYFKLNNFNIGLTQPLPFAVTDIEDAMATVDLYRGTWYHSTASELTYDEFAEEEIDIEEYMELEEKLKQEPKEAILELSELALNDSGEGFSEEEIDDFMQAIGLVLDARIFTTRDVVAGRNEGFKFFNLNKGAIMDLMEEVAEVFGESLTYEDKIELRAALGKFSLSGIYRIEEAYDIIDSLLVRFRLSNVETLKNLELNYRYKLSDLNKENTVKAPLDYKQWVSPFADYEDDYYYEDDWSEDEWWDEEWYEDEYLEEDF